MLIRAHDITKEYDSGTETVRALRGVSFRVQRGEFVTVVGPSGSGKSTTMHLLGLLDTPTAGTITLDGTDVETYDDGRRTRVRQETIGFVFQSYGLIPTLTALENVAVPRLLDSDPQETEERAEWLLDRVGLGDRLDHHPSELSGGQKQRVAIARSLINDPEVVLADEPTGNLDRETGERVLSDLLDAADVDVTVVAVTHDEYVAEFSDRTLRLVDGRLRRDASDTLADETADQSADDDAGGDTPASTETAVRGRNADTERGGER